jgi:plasmid stabilization system protein ParE
MPAVVLLSGAENDSLEIFTRLESRDTEAADAFYHRLDESLGQLRMHPESAPIYEGKIRRLVMRGHPLGIFFTVEGERLFVQPILDLRQEPERIRHRLGLEK